MSDEIPNHLVRNPTRRAIDALAQRFGLPNDPQMQDWQYEVADSTRIDEFVAAYVGDDLSEDERFVLMQTILQSFEDLGPGVRLDSRWPGVLGLVEASIGVHIATVWYWAALGSEVEDAWVISPSMRTILAKHRRAFEDAG